jgi:hypothetical protein
MTSQVPAISETTPAPGYKASSTVGKIAEQGPLTGAASHRLDDGPGHSAEHNSARHQHRFE